MSNTKKSSIKTTNDINTYDPVGGHTKEEADREYNRLMRELHGSEDGYENSSEAERPAAAAQPVYVVGRGLSSLDSVASAIGYAFYKNKTDKYIQYFPRIGNQISQEVNNFFIWLDKNENLNQTDDFQIHLPEIIDGKNLDVILVDHNSTSDSFQDIGTGNILEIIDSHSLAGLSTTRPIFVKIEPLGATTTIISEMLQAAGIDIPESLASIMAAAILFNTKLFTTKTTTQRDKLAALTLSNLANLDLQALYGEV